MRRLRQLAFAIGTLSMTATAQHDGDSTITPVSAPTFPFGVGERADYSVKFGFIPAGSGTMEVLGIDTVRGLPAFHTVFRVRGGVPGYRVMDRLESWMDIRNLAALRHRQELSEGRRDRERQFEIFPDKGIYIEDAKDTAATVPLPLDDGSFLFFIRTVPLEIGSEYVFNRYFRPDRNPVTIQVLRRERIRVPAGTFDAIVIRPIIKSRGVFSENGRAEVWLSDDENRVMLQMKSHLRIGSLNLYLKSYRPPTVRSATPATRTASDASVTPAALDTTPTPTTSDTTATPRP
jgi:hypothetical protein